MTPLTKAEKQDRARALELARGASRRAVARHEQAIAKQLDISTAGLAALARAVAGKTLPGGMALAALARRGYVSDAGDGPYSQRYIVTLAGLDIVARARALGY